MEELKRARMAQRAGFTKAYKKLEELVLKPDVDIFELETELNVFISKEERLEKTHENILALTAEKEFEKEYETVEDFRDRALRLRLRAEKIISVKRNSNIAISSLPESSNNKENSNNLSNHKFKLPKLELRKFDGDIKDWLQFWSQFEKIHTDPCIANSDKFQYLLQVTVEGSRARNVIESFPPTGDNYNKAIESLKSRFGREDFLVEVYVRELLKLVLKNSSSHNYSHNLCALYDNLESQIRALESLGVTTDKSAALLYPLVESCMPEDFLRAWQRSSHTDHTGDPKGRLDNLLKFLKTEVESEERINLAMTGFELKDEIPLKKEQKKHSASTAASLLSTSLPENSCIFCNGKHDCVSCYKAQKMVLATKQKILKEKGACFRCFKIGHRAQKCKAYVRCLVCEMAHNIMMCPELPHNKVPVNKSCLSKSEKNSKDDKNSVNLASISNSQQVLLQTLKVNLIGKDNTICVRALYDSGSQKSYIRKEIASRFAYFLRQQPLSHALFGGKRTSEEIHNVYRIELGNLNKNFYCNFDAYDVETICEAVPSSINGPWMDELKAMNIDIYDTENANEPIDILIGADVAGRLFAGKRKVLSCGLVAIQTYLGWTLMGKTAVRPKKEDTAMMVISMFVKEATISDLFSLDVLGITDPVEKKSKEENELLTKQFFQETVAINDEGRYEVALPWKDDHLPLPTNKELARKRLETSTKKLLSENMFTVYDDVFKEWISLDIIEDIPDEGSTNEHYLPHRPVIKQQGTTKIRPVFDASARQIGSPSLNQCLESGPNLIELIPNLLLRFRQYKFGITADIEKAFLQISIRPEERDYLRFFWWEENDGQRKKVKIMRHSKVVFGLKSSPFLLGAVLDHHLQKYLKGTRFDERFVKILLNNFYVDNLVTSLSRKCEISPFIDAAHCILAEGKFNLRGWQYTGDEDYSTRITPVLGLLWDRKDDLLKINLDWTDNYSFKAVSKRIILSVAHKVFDPIGLLCPVSLKPKLLLQKMWKLDLTWDSEVNAEIKKEFMDWFSELHLLKQVSIKRCLLSDASHIDGANIHTFCDASLLAYAAVVFLRVETSRNVYVRLLAAKSRVAPMKSPTIPRLELLAATVGARLCKSVMEGLQWKNVKRQFWTDSTTVLSWIQRKETWTVFVNNRVQEIRKLTDPALWKHVSGNDNPADLLSRGCSASQLSLTKWWVGPPWLRKPESNWPVKEKLFDEDAISREKRKTSSTVISQTIFSRPNKSETCKICKVASSKCRHHKSTWYHYYFSKYDKIVRMVAWIRRFIYNCRNPADLRMSGELSCHEFKEAEKKIIKLIQDASFTENDNKKLKNLSTYTDNNGILRLKTKITFRKDLPDFRNPMILPSDHPVVRRLIMSEHRKNSHAGSQILLNILRECYWILNSRKTVRSIISKCTVCLRHAKQNLTTPTSSLPENRVRDAAVFEIIGIDMTGPLYLRDGSKAWICLYTCAIYRAIHLELLSSLDTATFLLSFRRFIARRGRPSVVYCDNGTNFVGASNQLKSVDWDEIAKYSTTRKIQWFFNPPTAPWWGGFWERLIGVVKNILRKVLGQALLGYEEMTTVLCDTERVVNSRPLTYASESDGELAPLSPNNFLNDFSQAGVPDFDQIDERVLNKRLRYRQKLISDIRKRFRSEYLGLLIQRNDQKKHDQVKIGDVVLIGCDNTKCIEWPLGLVTELFPGKDNITRLVRLKTSKGLVLRPVQRLFPLEVSTNLIKPQSSKERTTSLNQESSDKNEYSHSEKLCTRSGRKIKAPQKLDL